ncbi:MAG: hypothetical protein ABIG60_05510 [Patescibacteria group bacterium]
MLALKKIGLKKLIIYLFIISFMLSGTGFFIYKNHKLTSKSGEAIMELAADYDNSKYELDNLNSITNKNIKDLPSQDLEKTAEENKEKKFIAEQARLNQLIDLSLLEDEKYKKLQNNPTILKTVPAGKSNPFQAF